VGGGRDGDGGRRRQPRAASATAAVVAVTSATWWGRYLVDSFLHAAPSRLAALAARDPDHRRFGAVAHGYQLRPRLDEARLAAFEARIGVRLPEAYRDFVGRIGDGGAGPGYGLVPLARAGQLAGAALPSPLTGPLRHPADPDDAYGAQRHLDGTVLLSDHGCGYSSVLVVNGPERGRVYLDLRGAGDGLVPSHADFVAWYAEWLAAMDHDPPLIAGPARADRCAPPNALENFLSHYEEEAEVSAGGLDAAAVGQALLGIPDGGLATRGDANMPRYFAEGDPVRLCANCQAMIDRFVARGMMRPAQVLAGVPTLIEREEDLS
jgi:hypothetical protein